MVEHWLGMLFAVMRLTWLATDACTCQCWSDLTQSDL